jgi:hypothetical protein
MGYSFDGSTKIISLTSGTVVLDVKDMYSRWKDWVILSDNSKWDLAFQSTGGDIIDSESGTSIPLYAFLSNGWRIKPQEANHTLNVTNGILLVAEGGDPFINTTGSFIVRINYQQPVQAITVSKGTASNGYEGNQINVNVGHSSVLVENSTTTDIGNPVKIKITTGSESNSPSIILKEEKEVLSNEKISITTGSSGPVVKVVTGVE